MIPLNPGKLVGSLDMPQEGQVESEKVAMVSFSGGVNEVQSITCPAVAASTQADYFVVEDTAGQSFAVWLDIDANGTAPTGAAYVASDFQIQVAVVTGDLAADVATKVKAALDGDSNFLNITTALDDDAVVLTQDLPGNVTAPAVHDAGDLGAGSFVAATDTGGALPSLNSKYILFSSSGVDYYAWANVNGGGVDPSVASRTGVEVALTGNETAAGIASAFAAAIDALALLNAEADGSTLQINGDAKGNLTDASAGNSGLSVSIQAQGVSASYYPGMDVSSISNNPSA